MPENFPSKQNPGPEEARRLRRLEVLRMKSATSSDQFRPRAEQITVRDKNMQEKAGIFKKKYLERNPGDAVGADIAAGMARALENDRRLHSRELRTKEERFAVVVQQAKFNAQWTEYVHKNSKDENFMKRHWAAIESIKKNENEETSYRFTRAGVITQVATLKIFEALKVPCEAADETQDGILGVDYWLEPENQSGRRDMLQIKGRWNIEHVEVVETDTMSPLTIRVNGGLKEAVVTSTDMDNILKLRRKLDEYAHQQNLASIRGFYITIPNNREHINRNTGEPTRKLIDEVATELRRLKYLPEDQKVELDEVAA